MSQVVETASTPTPTVRKRRFLPRFSLRTLVIAVLAVGSGLGLWWHWEPWNIAKVFDTRDESTLQLKFSQDGKLLLSYSREGRVRIWEVDEGSVLRHFDLKEQQAGDFHFSPDGTKILFSQFSTGTPWLRDAFCVWNWKSDLEPVKIDTKNSAGSEVLMLSPDGLRKITASGLPTQIALQDRLSGSHIFSLSPDSGNLHEFSVDGSILACGSRTEKVLQIRSGVTGKQTFSLTTSAHRARPVGFSADGSFVFVNSSSLDGWRVLVFDLHSRNLAATFDIPKRSIPDSAPYSTCSPSKRRFVTSSGQTILWDFPSGQIVKRFDLVHYFPDWMPQFTADSTRLFLSSVVASEDTSNSAATVVDAEDGRILYRLSPPDIYSPCVDYSPARDEVAAGYENMICLWQRRRPEWWWGIAWLPEFWLTFIFLIALAWSLRRDFKTLRKAKAA